MRASIAGAVLLLASGGSAGVAALDVDGNHVALAGTDALFDITNAVLASCGTRFDDFAAKGLTYAGAGSAAGVTRMALGEQRIAPLSRALKSPELCAVTAAGGAPGLTSELLVAVEGVAVVANRASTCSTTVPNNVGAAGAFPVTSDGTTGGTIVGSYTFADSFDALRVLYFGLTHDGAYDCAGPVRRTLIRQWRWLFSTDCAAGNATCTAGLTHAWRRSDLASATETFVAVLAGAGDLPSRNGVPVGLGSSSTAPGAFKRMNPFCNAADANATPPTASFAGESDVQDADPIRTSCVPGKDNVCERDKVPRANFQGDLGVVLPIVLPRSSVVTQADLYPEGACSLSCTLVGVAKGNQLPNGFRCPMSGNTPTLGACWMPYAGPAAAPEPRCVSANTQKCFDLGPLRDDSRAYNRAVLVPSTQIPANRRGGFTYQIAYDDRGHLLDKTFFRVHSTTPGTGNVADPAVGRSGLCRETDDTSQIGCLVDSDPCSVGFAAREAARSFPGLGTPAVPQPAREKALALNGTAPFATAAGDPTNVDVSLQNLVAPPGTTPLYPLARRLTVATLFGFGNLQGGERQLSQCFADATLVGASLSGGLIGVPGGVRCVDYPEQAPTATIAPNTQGTGNAALGGCGMGLAAHDACTDPITAPAICGDGVVASGFGETCDPPNGTTCDGSCRAIP